MGLSCFFGNHSYGLPRSNGDGTITIECMNCLRMELSPVRLPRDEGAAASLDVRRAQAIANLVAEERWVGIPSNPPNAPNRTAVEDRTEDAGSLLVPRPQAA
jgi:hypothetical protein